LHISGLEIKQEYHLNKIIIIPLVLSAVGVIPNMLNQSLLFLIYCHASCPKVQTMAVLNISSIVRKFLDEQHLSGEEDGNL
jgi:hypothetical protein